MSDKEYLPFSYMTNITTKDVIRAFLAFIAPAVFIYMVVVITVPDMIDESLRFWIFISTIVSGSAFLYGYIMKLLIPAIKGRIADKEALVKYQSEMIKLDEESRKDISAEDEEAIKILSERTGMSIADARIAYSKINLRDIDERVKQKKLKPANVVEES